MKSFFHKMEILMDVGSWDRHDGDLKTIGLFRDVSCFSLKVRVDFDASDLGPPDQLQWIVDLKFFVW